VANGTSGNTDSLLLVLSDRHIADGLPELRWNVLHEVLGGCRTVVIDLADVTTLTSSAVAALLNIHRLCRARRGQLVLRDPTGAVLDLLRHARLDRLLTIETAGGITSSPGREHP
jgi:anti-anti-sigma factor